MNNLRFALCISMCTALSACSTIFGGSGDSQSNFVKPSGSDDAQYLSGKAHLAAGERGLAIDDFRAVLANDPQSVAALNGLAIAYAGIGRNDMAAAYFKRALLADPYSAVTLNNTAHFDLAMGDHAGAQFYATRAAIVEKIAAGNSKPDEHLAALMTATEQNFAQANDKTAAPGKVAEAAPKAAPVKPVEVVAEDVSAKSAELPQKPEMVAAATPARHQKPNVPEDVLANVPEPAEGRPLVRVSNGAGLQGLAENTAHFLSERGISVNSVSNEPSFDHSHSVIYYNPGLRDYASAMSGTLPMHPQLIEAKHGNGQVELILGADAAELSGGIEAGNKRA
jgi:tetratricopeptide (TPR) repeat protein